MAKTIINGVEFGLLKSGKAYAEVPRFEFAFKRCMNSIRAEWKSVGGTMMWVFKAEEMGYAQKMAAAIFVEVEAAEPAPRQRTVKEEFAVAMGLGLIPQQDLND
jgi:hypothetical protein